MSYIDIRDSSESDVTRIKFDSDHTSAHASFLTRTTFGLRLEDGDGCGETAIRPEGVKALAKALEKAIELGWAE